MNKRMKKWLAILLGSILLLFSFSGCEKTGPIPNGCYIFGVADENVFFLYEGDKNVHDPGCWEIEGDHAQRWTSGSIDYKAKIVERNGKIYFEGYKFRILFGERGVEHVYGVEYDTIEKSITIDYNIAYHV